MVSMPKTKDDYMPYIDVGSIEYDKLVKELNELDCVMSYRRGGPDGMMLVIYEGHPMQMTRQEGEAKLAWLKKIKGIKTVKTKPKKMRQGTWRKDRHEVSK
jgi:hypothetical protein